MLVLSRKLNQHIVFPTQDIRVEVLRIEGTTVRLGVTAPPSVVVLRGELDDPNRTEELAHKLRGRFNTAMLSINLARRQLELGKSDDAQMTLDAALNELARLEQSLVPAPRPPRRIRTLLVEDNPHESALLQGYLRLNGVDVDNAGDGDEALDYLARHECPDAVLLDMQMPRRDGASTLAAIRADPAYNDLKVFAVTGAKREDVPIESGFDGWFTKPIDPARIVEALARAVGN